MDPVHTGTPNLIGSSWELEKRCAHWSAGQMLIKLGLAKSGAFLCVSPSRQMGALVATLIGIQSARTYYEQSLLLG